MKINNFTTIQESIKKVQESKESNAVDKSFQEYWNLAKEEIREYISKKHEKLFKRFSEELMQEIALCHYLNFMENKSEIAEEYLLALTDEAVKRFSEMYCN